MNGVYAAIRGKKLNFAGHKKFVALPGPSGFMWQ